jgi:hypothetical protein
VFFQASKPVQVAQFGSSSQYDQLTGDPCEILLPPVECYLPTNLIYVLPPTNAIDPTSATTNLVSFALSYTTVYVPTSATTNTYLDGQLINSTNFLPLGASGFSAAEIDMSTNWGPHTISCSQPVGVQVYGWANYDAYSYFGGILR